LAALSQVLAAPAKCGSLKDIQHVVIFINENRSFDSYFGTYRGVRGFEDPKVLKLHDGSGQSIFHQPGYKVKGYGGHLDPFRFDTQNSNGECVNDINHSWGPQHLYWNKGRMDSFVTQHLKIDGAANGPNTMGYYKRSDLEFYYALADAFTLCDGYFCSVIGPTDPNRLYSMTATLDPAGKNGGPHLSTLVTDRASKFGSYTWTTMPERLSAKGITWKVYANPDGNFGDNVLNYFKNYYTDPQLAANAFAPTFPGEFQADCAAGTLPQVSWVLAPLVQTEHPPAPVTWGEVAVSQIISGLTSNSSVWNSSALFITWDEGGGFFDHVPPPVAPPGTAGEFLTVDPLPAAASKIRGPIGLGFRVPLLVVSPFARGGFVSSDVFDHTSLLRFLETRFNVEVPNLTAWRRSVTGDLTSAFNFAAPNTTVPTLPSPSLADQRVLGSDCPTNAPVSEIDEGFPSVQSYTVPPNSMPKQEPGRPRRPSGLACAQPGGRNNGSSGGSGSSKHKHRRGGGHAGGSSGGGGSNPSTTSVRGEATASKGSSSAGSGLPFTGAEVGGFAGAGAILAVAGGVLLRLFRRRAAASAESSDSGPS
jgi:phospholipase C